MKNINEDLNIAGQENKQSPAAQEAARLGLQYVGFGRYEDPRTRQISHIVQNEKLIPFKKAIRTGTYQQQSSDDIGNFSTNVLGPQTQELHAFLTSKYTPDKYNDKELNALSSFVNGGYADINARLLQLPAGIPAKSIEPRQQSDGLADMVAALDSAIKKSRAPLEFITYAKIGSDYNLEDFAPGRSFIYKGYRSTNIDVRRAIGAPERVGMTGRNQTAVLQIRVKKNARGIYTSDYNQDGSMGDFLLPRGARIDIVSGPNKLVGSDAASASTNLEILYFDCVSKS